MKYENIRRSKDILAKFREADYVMGSDLDIVRYHADKLHDAVQACDGVKAMNHALLGLIGQGRLRNRVFDPKGQAAMRKTMTTEEQHEILKELEETYQYILSSPDEFGKRCSCQFSDKPKNR